MNYDPIQAVFEGAFGAWARALLSLAIVALSTVLGIALEDGLPPLGTLFAFPICLAAACGGWGLLIPISFLLILILGIIAVHSVHSGFTIRKILYLVSIPFFVILAPDWFRLVRDGLDKDSGGIVASFFLFILFIWKFRGVLFQSFKAEQGAAANP